MNFLEEFTDTKEPVHLELIFERTRDKISFYLNQSLTECSDFKILANCLNHIGTNEFIDHKFIEKITVLIRNLVEKAVKLHAETVSKLNDNNPPIEVVYKSIQEYKSLDIPVDQLFDIIQKNKFLVKKEKAAYMLNCQIRIHEVTSDGYRIYIEAFIKDLLEEYQFKTNYDPLCFESLNQVINQFNEQLINTLTLAKKDIDLLVNDNIRVATKEELFNRVKKLHEKLTSDKSNFEKNHNNEPSLDTLVPKKIFSSIKF